MNLPDHDIAFAVDPELKEHWLDGWSKTSGSGRAARGLVLAGLVGAVLFCALALLTTDFGAVAREVADSGETPALTHLTFLCVGAVCCLVLAAVAALCIRRFETSASRRITGERLVIDREGYLVYVRRDERELVDTGDGRYFWGRAGEGRRVRASVAYLPACAFYLLDEYRELVILPQRPGALRERAFASERELEASGALRGRLNVGHRAPADLAADAPDDRELGLELLPYFSPDLTQTLRDLGVPEAPERRVG